MTATINRRDALILLHFIVFIWGFTGILGKEIDLDSFQMVWWRVLIAAIAIGAYSLFTHKSLGISRALMLKFGAVGAITAAHWICFFASIKVSNISTALAVLSTTSFFVAFVAPIIRRTGVLWYEMLLGVFVIGGLTIIFQFESQYTHGIILSLLAAFFAAVFSSFNSVFVAKHPPHQIAFYEMAGGTIVTTAYLAFSGSWSDGIIIPGFIDSFLLLILAVLATAYAFIAGIKVMQVLTPFTCAMAINLEPIYTIIFALLLYGESEFMSAQFYIGALIILSTLFINAWMKRRPKVPTPV